MDTLPHATIGRLMGLLEAMARTEGPDDIRTLAQALHLDLEDLLPLLDAARLFGWSRIKAGQFDLTPEGRIVLDGDERTRQRFFRESISDLPLIREIQAAVGRGEPAPCAALRERLASELGSEEAERQIATAIIWGRYAELFDYDADRACFVPTASPSSQ